MSDKVYNVHSEEEEDFRQEPLPCPFKPERIHYHDTSVPGEVCFHCPQLTEGNLAWITRLGVAWGGNGICWASYSVLTPMGSTPNAVKMAVASLRKKGVVFMHHKTSVRGKYHFIIPFWLADRAVRFLRNMGVQEWLMGPDEQLDLAESIEEYFSEQGEGMTYKKIENAVKKNAESASIPDNSKKDTHRSEETYAHRSEETYASISRIAYPGKSSSSHEEIRRTDSKESEEMMMMISSLEKKFDKHRGPGEFQVFWNAIRKSFPAEEAAMTLWLNHAPHMERVANADAPVSYMASVVKKGDHTVALPSPKPKDIGEGEISVNESWINTNKSVADRAHSKWKSLFPEGIDAQSPVSPNSVVAYVRPDPRREGLYPLPFNMEPSKFADMVFKAMEAHGIEW